MTIDNEVIDISPDELVGKYGKMVSALCRRMIMDGDKAQDAAQEAWIEIINSLYSFKGNSQISTWIYTITKRVVMRNIRKDQLYSTRFLHKLFSEFENITAPDLHPAEKRMWVKEKCDECLTGVVHCLDSESRLAYLFKEIINLPYRDIAHILEKNEPGVRQIVSRSKRKMKNFLSNNCILYNPLADCNCKYKNAAEHVDLPGEYRKLKETIRDVNFFQEAEMIFPRKNYWEKYL